MRPVFRYSVLAAFVLSLSHAFAGTPTQLAIFTGDNQTAPAGTPVPNVVCVVVRDASNLPVQGVTVTWGSITGGGSITGETQVTDASGIATLGSWTLGAVPGTNTTTVTSAGLNSVTFTATGLPGAPATIEAVSGNNQTGTAGTAVTTAVSAVVKDANGNAVPGVSVTWSNPTAGGKITGETQTTDASGIATLGSWTLGKSLGNQTVIANAAGLTPVTFTATAVAGAPAVLAVAIGNFQTATAGTTLPDVVCAVIRDANAVPVQGVTVTFSSPSNGGSITGATQITDASGIVTLGSWTLGATPGINTVLCDCAGLPTLTFTATGVAAASAPDNVVIEWNKVLLQAIKNTKVTPPVSSRALAIVHTATFDAWAAYDEKAAGTQLGDTLRRPEAERTQANKEIAISFAAYRTLVDLFPTQKALFDKLMADKGLDATNNSTDPATAAGVGNAVAAAIIEFRRGDSSNQLGTLNPGAYTDFTSYAPVNTADTLTDPGRWQPLRLPNGTTPVFITPHWGLVTPFAIGEKTSKTRKRLTPKAPVTHPSKKYQKQADEIVALSAALDDTTKTIATYWADGGGTVTPPGHWFDFARFISNRDQHTLDDDVKLFFALGNAVFDAGIAVWDCKVKYDSVRPISAIRFLYKGKEIEAWGGPAKGTQKIMGETWLPYIVTPPFAEYISGHSTFSAAGAQILRSFTRKTDFGMSVTIPAGFSLIEPNTPAEPVTLTWKKFTDAANEAGMSRRYGGIHFKDGDLQGRALGKKIGAIVYKKALQYIEGKVKP